MLVDRMHSDAIRDADASMLPQTVYRIGNDWYHSNALWVRAQLPDAWVKRTVLVVTWLPSGFFN